MSEQQRLCVDCKHFVPVGAVSARCMRRAKRRVEPVRGLVTYSGKRDAELERSVPWRCGPKGRFWTSKEAGP